MEAHQDIRPLHEMFAQQAARTPHAIAVVTEDGRSVTYQELDSTTDTLSAWLRMKGVTLNKTVGIYMERCLDYTMGYIAALKAGGGYMPMDPSYPIPLLHDIVEDARPVVVLTQEDLVDRLPGSQLKLVTDADWLERIQQEVTSHGVIPAPPSVGLDDLAYTVYSSGTTGKPKGIQCPHRGSVLSYTWRGSTYPYSPDEREACNVFFTWEMLRPLLFGATLYIIPDTTIYDPRLLCAYLERNRINRILFTPSLFEALLDTDGLDVVSSLKHLKTLIFCGEVVTVGLLERCITLLPWVRFLNLYSISEAHDVACTDLTQWYNDDKSLVSSKKFCPVGRLLPGVKVVILDDEMNPQPVGVSGEIYIGGATLALGYLNRPELNAARFISRPASVSEDAGPRLYKAGDWGYMLSDGSFEICGRCDSMVKIRGYSIETQAVENSLLELPMVNACVVLVIGAEGEDKRLVAYIVPQDKTTNKKGIRAELKKRLPFYMIPSHFVFLDSIPILPASGKLDKKALPPITASSETTEEEGRPSTDTERALETIWANVLGQTSIDVQESFFDLGGHSLLATRLLTDVRERFSVDLTVRDLFVHATISAMARLIDHRLGAGTASEETSIKLNLKAEVDLHDQDVLDMDIQLRAFWRSMAYKDKWHKGRVLLTGATGFLGAFLLRDLLQQTESQVFCITRELPDRKGVDRIHDTLVKYGLLDDDSDEGQILTTRFKRRVSVFQGDIGLVGMGLSEDDYTYLSTEIDYIIHAAAHVNLIYPYQALHGPNVLGTQNVVRFACTSKIKPVHYISTDAVFPHGLTDCSESQDITEFHDQLEDGYSQSKWVAECLVQRAMARGLPTVIYRLGNLSGDRENAAWNPADYNLLLIQSLARTHCGPDVAWNIEMTPVDFASRVIVGLSRKMAAALGKVFHIINTKPLKASWLYEWMSAHGYPVESVPFNTWKERVKEQTKDNNSALVRLVDGMIKDESFFSRLSTYKQEALTAALQTLDLKYPELNSSLLETYFFNLSVRRVIPLVRRNTLMARACEGRVAVVTGASSGIGAAVCLQLAKAGAHVALAARRVEKLETLKNSIIKSGGVAIAVKCDVTDKEQVRELFAHTECTLGPVDILVNNAGVMYYTYMKNLREDQWEHQIDLNCKGTMNCIGAALDGLIKRGTGHIVNMSSDAGRKGFPGLAVYSGTKFFIEGMSQALRGELASTGVKVTCIQPGDVKTELLSHSTDAEAKAAFDGSTTTTVLQPDDIGRAVVYAVSQPPHTAVNEILIEPREAPL